MEAGRDYLGWQVYWSAVRTGKQGKEEGVKGAFLCTRNVSYPPPLTWAFPPETEKRVKILSVTFWITSLLL